VSAASKNDTVLFGAGIADDQLWFTQAGNNLDVNVIGSGDHILIKNWFANPADQVQQFQTADGNVLAEAQVQNLVNAMAAFAPPAAGQTTLPGNIATTIEPVIAANWHPHA
jgi:hypothetical protein